jgi:hypothetical protein
MMNCAFKHTKVAHAASDEAQTAARLDHPSQDLPRHAICYGHEADSRNCCSPMPKSLPGKLIRFANVWDTQPPW